MIHPRKIFLSESLEFSILQNLHNRCSIKFAWVYHMTFFGCSARSLGLGLYEHTSKPVLGGRCLALESVNGGFWIFGFHAENNPRPPPCNRMFMTTIIADFCTLYQSDIESQISNFLTSGVLEHSRAIGRNSKIGQEIALGHHWWGNHWFIPSLIGIKTSHNDCHKYYITWWRSREFFCVKAENLIFEVYGP